MVDSALDAPAPAPLDESTALALLRHGALDLEGLLAEASNATLRAVINLDGVEARCIYKPVRGERPLWDFPDGTLAGRELAAYLVSTAGGWGVTPPTVLRDGPLGLGACQLWLDDAHSETVERLVGFVPAEQAPAGWRAVVDARGPDNQPYVLAHADDPRLAAIAVFDAVVNNADRKGGHVLTTSAGRVYGVDHGVCFHTDDKLRTVLWGWVGEPLGEPAAERLHSLLAALEDTATRAGLAQQLAQHISSAEVKATARRARQLLTEGVFPAPRHERSPLPWPPM